VRAPANGNDPAELAEYWLARAYELVEHGWCQGALARDGAGCPVAAESPLALAWSAPGALLRVWREAAEPDDAVGIAAFGRANLALTAAVRAIPAVWNDAPGRRRQAVLEALLAAVSLVRTLPNPVRPRGSGSQVPAAMAGRNGSRANPAARARGVTTSHTCAPSACACGETGELGGAGPTTFRVRPSRQWASPSVEAALGVPDPAWVAAASRGGR
jgi:DNA-binding beta-propeller fold protein YncE